MPLAELIASTTTALGIGAAYTSPAFALDNADVIVGSIYSDVAGSLAVQQSNDGTNWDIVDTIAYVGGTTVGIDPIEIRAKYGRVVYTNGGVAQASFRLYVLKKKGTTASSGGTADLTDLKAETGILFEQPDVPVTINATNAAETDILDLSVAATRYILRNLLVKCADPGANTVTVRLYLLVNDVALDVDSFAINAANFAYYHNLMEMFGVPQIAGDDIRITVRASAGGPYAITGQYSHAKNNV